MSRVEIAMEMFAQNEPLTDAELDRLGNFLRSCKGGGAMNLEKLDGFFAALIAGPETVMPSEYLPEVFGGEMSETCKFGSVDEANDMLGLMMRHWNTIAATLLKDEPYVPLLLKDKGGVAHGNDWAHGFMKGMYLRHAGWAELLDNEEHGGCVIPMMALYHEHDEDPEMRPKPISPEKREEIIVHMAAGLLGAYRYFRAHREANAAMNTVQPRRTAPKTGQERPVPLRLREEIQAVLRRGGGKLMMVAKCDGTWICVSGSHGKVLRQFNIIAKS